MLDSLAQVARGAFGGEEIDRLMRLPVTQLRLDLREHERARRMDAGAYDGFVARLSSLEDISAQKKLAEEALEKGSLASERDIDLSTPAKRLLWGATVLRRMDIAPETGAAGMPLWNQLLSASAVKREEIVFSKMITRSMQDKDIDFGWGSPGTGFYHDPVRKYVNLDFLLALDVGFEHVHAAQGHEQGHKEISTTFTPRMRELYEKVKGELDPRLADQGDKKEMTKAEQKAMARDVKEWKLRFMLWHKAEDNAVNQFSVNMEDVYLRAVGQSQDFRDSMNHVGVVLQGLGAALRGDDLKVPVPSLPPPKDEEEARASEMALLQKAAKIAYQKSPLEAEEIGRIAQGQVSPEFAEKMFSQIANAVMNGFFVHNGLFSDRKKNWERLHIYPEEINAFVDVSDVPAARGRTAFEYLMDLSAGDHGIHSLQPKVSDRYFGKAHYDAKVAETSAARNAVTEHIWDVYLKPFAEILMHDYENKTEKNLEQQQDQSDDPQPDNGGGPQPQQQQDGQGRDDKPRRIDKSLRDDIGDMDETPAGRRERQQAAGGGEAMGQPEARPAEEKGAQQQTGGGQGQKKDEERRQQVRKAGELREKETPKETAPVPAKGGGGTQEAPKEEPGQKQPAPASGASGKAGLDMASLARGKWTDYRRRTGELMPLISKMAAWNRKLRNAQMHSVRRRSQEHVLLPPNDLRGRLDMDKKIQGRFRELAGRPKTLEDRKNFHTDQSVTVHSSIEKYYLIDGSISMRDTKLPGGVTAMEAALQSAVTGYEADRRAGIDSYILIWGDDTPRVIATPDTPRKKVGETLESVRRGINSGTNLAPALLTAVLTGAEHKTPPGTVSGSSHFLLYSDGDIGDFAEAARKLADFARHARNMSVDIAVMQPPGKELTKMEEAFLSVIDPRGKLRGKYEKDKKLETRLVGLMRSEDPQAIPLQHARQMWRRVRSFRPQPEPDAEKRRRLKALHRRMAR